MLDSEENSVKVIVVGDGYVGKTSMLRRFVRGEFVNHYKKTIGAEFMEKNVFLRYSNTTVKLMLWDTAGQEVFNSLTQAYYRGAGAAILTFSTVDRDSFSNVENWKKSVEGVCGSVPMILCQTKFDLATETVVTNEEAEQLAIRLQLPFFRISTKDDFNVTQLFEYTAGMCLTGDGTGATQGPPDPSDATSPPNANVVSGGVGGEIKAMPSKPVNLKEVKPEKQKKKKNRCALL